MTPSLTHTHKQLHSLSFSLTKLDLVLTECFSPNSDIDVFSSKCLEQLMPSFDEPGRFLASGSQIKILIVIALGCNGDPGSRLELDKKREAKEPRGLLLRHLFSAHELACAQLIFLQS